MKRFLLPIFLVLMLALPGCRSQAAPSADLAPGEILQAMLDACAERAEEPETISDREELVSYLADFYGLAEEQWSDAAVARLSGARAFELAVVLLPEDAGGAGLEAAVELFQTYLLRRQGDFTGYAPDQAMLAGEGEIFTTGRYAALAVCQDTDAVIQAFAACFDGGAQRVSAEPTASVPAGRIPYVDPNLDDMTIYDTAGILEAWTSGSVSALSAEDRATLEAAQAVLEETVSPGMSDYEKERAVYTWLTATVDYDWAHNDNRSKMDPHSPTPYGGLVNHKAICLGFATTFQLLMDMCDVECITVVGAAFQSREDHAWNMVRLDGQWYCVDATWDMGVGQWGGFFQYFNVTSDHMAGSDHQWDYSSVPEATAVGGGKP